jgi:Tol biopolymer transport system component
VSSRGGDPRRLAACGFCGTPAWSPDGRWIALSGDIGGRQALWIVAAAGGKPHRLTHCTGCADGDPVWSPDGRLLVFERTALPDGTITRLYTVRPDGSHLTRIAEGIDEQTPPQWSPDGRRLTFQDDRGIEVENADGSDARLVFAGPPSGPGDPAWSPDGRKLVILNTPIQPPGATSFAVEVWTINADGTDPQRIYNSGLGADDFAPAAIWSPDGRMIAFAVTTADSTSGTVVINGGTFVINADGTGLKLLTANTPTTYGDPSFSNLSWQPLPKR